MADIVSNGILRGFLQVPAYEPYEGEYAVVPKFSMGVTLNTKGKAMKENVTVAAIPVTEVDNAAGGKTLIIGG